jgi:hypothetical protein
VQKAIARQAASVTPSKKDNKKSSASETASSSIDAIGSSVVHTSLGDQFRTATLAKYGSTENAWDTFDNLSEPKGQLSRADFKSICKTIGLHVTSKDKGKLRKSIDKTNSKIIRLRDFEAFMSNGPATAIAPKIGQQDDKIANVPFDSPSLPDNYRARPEVETKLIDLLVGTTACKGSVVSAFGMGGAGKTCITAKVINTVAVRAKFPDGMAWVGLCQKPLLQNLQTRLYYQIMRENMPDDKRGSIEAQHHELQAAFCKKQMLIILDGEID